MSAILALQIAGAFQVPRPLALMSALLPKISSNSAGYPVAVWSDSLLEAHIFDTH